MRKLKTEELNRISPEAFQETEKIPITVVLDNVRSMNNVGSAFRSADAFLIEKIILTGITAQPPHREIQKTALGATETVIWQHVEHTLAAVTKLKNDGYTILPVEQSEGSTMLHTFEPKKGEKYCLVFGNEVFGVSDEVIAVADSCLEIPQYGTKHSLNISVTVGIVLWDIVSKLRMQ